MIDDSRRQRITRLTPLRDVLALIDARVSAVKPKRRLVPETLGCVLAEDVIGATCPPQPIALRDGYAVDSNTIADASAYAPVPLALPPRRIDVGQRLPEGADAILSHDAAVLHGDRVDAIAAIAAGEGVLPAGGDTTAQKVLRWAGQQIRAIDIFALGAVGLKDVSVRAPQISIVIGGSPTSQHIISVQKLFRHVLFRAGADVPEDGALTLERQISVESHSAFVAIGGTGSGDYDIGVRDVVKLGRVDVYGIAISPGETAGLGFVDTRPVLLVPGRIDAALAVWLLIGRHLVAKLAGSQVEDSPRVLPLKRKVTSTIGLTELIPVGCADGMAEPLASGYLSFSALVRSDGWIVVPADSEGFAAGTPVAVGPWP